MIDDVRTSGATAPIEVFYDGSCPVCTTEMMALARRDGGARLTLTDCSPERFRDPSADAPTRAVLMHRIHARDSNGRWLRGIDVFVAAYDAAGFHRTARVLASERLRPLLDRLYGLIADHRRLLATLRVHRLLARVLHGPRR
jgi:predicted DCC family thiol-disulfide oxidoreductase YuxK